MSANRKITFKIEVEFSELDLSPHTVEEADKIQKRILDMVSGLHIHVCNALTNWPAFRKVTSAQTLTELAFDPQNENDPCREARYTSPITLIDNNMVAVPEEDGC